MGLFSVTIAVVVVENNYCERNKKSYIKKKRIITIILPFFPRILERIAEQTPHNLSYSFVAEPKKNKGDNTVSWLSVTRFLTGKIQNK